MIPYRTGRLLGKGGMSDVYEAEASDGYRVAVKVFRREKESRFLEKLFMARPNCSRRFTIPISSG